MRPPRRTHDHGARGGQVAEGALEVGVAASRALGRSIRGGMIRKAIDKTKSLMDEDG